MKILAPFLSCVVNAGFEGDENNELEQALSQGYSFVYIISHNGIWLHQVLTPGKDSAPRFVRMKVKEIPGAKHREVQPWVAFLPDGKIPLTLFNEVRSFFLAVMRSKGQKVEAMIWVMWNQERGYFLHVPNQVVAGASARYDWDTLPANSSIVVDIHSHADMGAFFSGTDDGDDRGTVRFSGVFGRNSSSVPMTVWRFNWKDVKQEVTVEDLFENPPVLETVTPAEWLDKVKLTSETYKGGYVSSHHARTIPEYTYGGHISGRGNFHQDSEAPRPGVQHQRGNQETDQKKNSGAGNSSSGRNSRSEQNAGGSARSGNRPIHEDTPSRVINVNGKPYTIPATNGDRYVDNGQFLEKLAHDAGTQSLFSDEELANLGISPITPTLPTIGSAEQAEDFDLDSYIGASPEGQSAALERMQMRLREESLLVDEDIRNAVAQDQEGILTGDQTGLVTDADGSWYYLSAEEYPTDFEQIACENGPQAAGAYAIINALSDSLVGTGEPLRNIVEEFFATLPTEEALPVFRKLYTYLDNKAVESLAANGL